jgi:outer membrane protein assembly factor BamB
MPSMDVKSICEDKDGHIWVGTAKGVSVFYNPENVFTGANWDGQQILIEQDGHVQILLENDVITAIAVDGVNRKWIGTESSGVYCLSPDGQEEIYHFTEENSPLYSNIIRDIVTDETTGDVFIGSENGIQSFRTPIIKGFEDFTKVHAYPNPIRPGNSTPVYITGLIDEADVKITDVSGNLIWSTKSQGGQVVWNLHSFSGTKAASGVYMIYCSSATGDKSATAKLLIIN